MHRIREPEPASSTLVLQRLFLALPFRNLLRHGSLLSQSRRNERTAVCQYVRENRCIIRVLKRGLRSGHRYQYILSAEGMPFFLICSESFYTTLNQLATIRQNLYKKS